MAKMIDPDKLVDSIEEISEEISKQYLIELKQVTNEVADEGLKIIKQTTAQAGIGGDTYTKSWKTEKLLRGSLLNATIFNRQYQLTHLLERGHPIVRNKKVVGRAAAFPHIKPAEEKINKLYLDKVKKIIR